MTDREAMQQALEALQSVLPELESVGPLDKFERARAAIALFERLAQPEPVAWEVGVVNGVVTRRLAQPEQEPTAERAWFTIADLNAWADKKLSENPHWAMPKDKPERDEPPPQRNPEQEPVAWEDVLGAIARGWTHDDNKHKTMDVQLAVAIAKEIQDMVIAPPQRKPLTDDEINNLKLPPSGTATVRDLVRIIEAAHGIKENT